MLKIVKVIFVNCLLCSCLLKVNVLSMIVKNVCVCNISEASLVGILKLMV